MTEDVFSELQHAILSCQHCADSLPLSPKSIIQIHPEARLLIAGQVPGKTAHDAGRPFDDLSGDRLRDWLGMTREAFYDAQQVAIVPMGFCFQVIRFIKVVNWPAVNQGIYHQELSVRVNGARRC